MFNTFNPSQLNYLAIFVATLAYFMLGALWFSKAMFSNAWMKAANIKFDETEKPALAGLMIKSFVATLLICFTLDVLIVLIGIHHCVGGIKLGLLIGVGIFFGTQFINSIYENRSNSLLLINGGYHLCGIVLSSIILAVWK